MASIRPIKNKEGEITSYQITVSAGRVGGKHNTFREYNHLMKRIVPAIGHIKLDKLRPQHLNAFYRNLEEQGVADVPDRATAKPDIREKVSTTQKALAAASGLSVNTVALALQGKRVSLSTAQAIAAALGRRVEELFTVDRRQEKLSSKTLLEYHRFISAVLAQAEKEMLVTYNAAQKATPPKLERKEAECFQPEEVEQIRDALEGEPVKWRTATHLLLITGVRRGELCGLKWEDFDSEAGTLKVRRTIHAGKGGELTAGDPKTYAGTRTILLPYSTAQFLQRRRETALTGWIFPDPFRPERPANPGSAYRRLKQILAEAKLPDIRFHDLRHTFATHALTSGVDAKTLSGILGHTKASFTLDTYTHVTGDMQRNAAEIVGDFMTEILGEEMRPWQKSESEGMGASI